MPVHGTEFLVLILLAFIILGPKQLPEYAAKLARVVVKARIARHQGRAFRSAPLNAHLSYLKRDGVTRDGEKAVMFDADSDRADDAGAGGRA